MTRPRGFLSLIPLARFVLRSGRAILLLTQVAVGLPFGLLLLKAATLLLEPDLPLLKERLSLREICLLLFKAGAPLLIGGR